jgi:N-terminal half of MaoC dehydratase
VDADTVGAMNPAAEGLTFPAVSFEVTPERVGAFRAIFGQERGVPPTFLTAAEFSVLPTVVNDPRLELDFARVLHGSQDYEYRRPLREGERLTIRARIASVRQRGGSGFVTIVMDVIDAAGDPVAVCRSTMIERVSA